MRYLLLFILSVQLLANGAVAIDRNVYQYIYPKPNSTRVSPHSTIILRFENGSPTHLNAIISAADENGDILGQTHLASDGKTIIFRPDEPFALGSTIHVSIQPENPLPVKPIAFQFHIMELPAIESVYVPEDELDNNTRSLPDNLGKPGVTGPQIMPNGVSVPSDFPHINVTTNIAPGDGYLFLNNRGNGTPFNIIFDNDGSPVWYLKTDDRRRDFKVQRNGTISMLVRSGGHRFRNFDINFNLLRDYSAVDGYSTDEHECLITEDGHVLLLGRKETRVDMSQYVSGGNRNATVRETAVQEFTPDGDKIFEWRAWDHFEDIIQYLEIEDLRGGYIRFPHMNAIDIDDDGHIILSSRNLSEISKINRQTGEFIWRLGGPKNEFTFVNDDLGRFRNQHAVMSLGNNHYTMFDNGTSRSPSVSRGVEYELDPVNKTATRVWEYRNPPGTVYSHYMGNCQRLPNGNTLINWAVPERPKATEVTPAGEVVYEMNWVESDECYRTFRFPWDGVVEKPNLFVEPGGTHIVLLFNKFGDDNVAYYNIYGDTRRNPTTLIDTSKTTMKYLRDVENGRTYYFRVTAVSNDGVESSYSEEQSLFVNIKPRGQNMVLNSDFSRSKRNWKFDTYNTASSTWTAVTREGHIQIENGGRDRRSIVFYQGEMPLEKGVEYLLEFDAYAIAPRIIEVMLCRAGQPDRNYSRLGLAALKNRKQRYSYVFTMQDNTDYGAELRFNVGAEEEDVFLDNVVLIENDGLSIDAEPESTPDAFTVIGNYPNPFNPNTTIQYQLPEQCDVSLRVYNMLGELVNEKSILAQGAGLHDITFDGSEFGSGLYFYEIETRTSQGTFWREVHKMMLIK